MNNLKFYKIVIVILVILNLGTLSFLWIGHSRGGQVPKYGQAGEFLIRELELTSLQQDNFGQLRDSHQKRQSILATHGGYTRPNADCSLEQRH